jgi:hypothetical protein
MSRTLSAAQTRAWNLATTLMTCIILFRAGEEFGVMPSSEFDGDPDTIIREYDPFAI